jgi:hypothetical protein
VPEIEVEHPLEQPEDDRAPELDPADLEALAADAVLPADEPVPGPPEPI